VTRLDDDPPPLTHISTAHCVAVDDEHVVLALHRDRDWTVPGGHLELGESPEAAATREAAEEAGAVVEDLILFAHEQVDPVDATPFSPDEARRAPGWIQFHGQLYEAALVLARSHR
jgi:8-oxo-dGTP pyrophosphatase MutT (NUDIX family)